MQTGEVIGLACAALLFAASLALRPRRRLPEPPVRIVGAVPARRHRRRDPPDRRRLLRRAMGTGPW